MRISSKLLMNFKNTETLVADAILEDFLGQIDVGEKFNMKST